MPSTHAVRTERDRQVPLIEQEQRVSRLARCDEGTTPSTILARIPKYLRVPADLSADATYSPQPVKFSSTLTGWTPLTEKQERACRVCNRGVRNNLPSRGLGSFVMARAPSPARRDGEEEKAQWSGLMIITGRCREPRWRAEMQLLPGVDGREPCPGPRRGCLCKSRGRVRGWFVPFPCRAYLFGRPGSA